MWPGSILLGSVFTLPPLSIYAAVICGCGHTAVVSAVSIAAVAVGLGFFVLDRYRLAGLALAVAALTSPAIVYGLLGGVVLVWSVWLLTLPRPAVTAPPGRWFRTKWYAN
jgi:hypothetical protein